MPFTPQNYLLYLLLILKSLKIMIFKLFGKIKIRQKMKILTEPLQNVLKLGTVRRGSFAYKGEIFTDQVN